MKNQTLILLLIICWIAAPWASAEERLQSPTGVIQPSTIPGDWNIENVGPFPPIEQALRSPSPGRLIYGLYTWAGEYKQRRKDISDVGWKALRFAGPFDDAIMKSVVEDDMSVMVTLSNRLLDPAKGKSRKDYPSDEELLADYTLKVLGFLDRYGPGGSFFKDNPELPNRPIVDIELWNEPNFPYLIPPDERPRVEIETAREKLYAKVLKHTYPAIKAKHPTVNVIGFSAGGMSSGDLRFIQHVHEIDPGVTAYYDVLSTHPYVRPAPPEANSVQSWGSYSIPGNLAVIRKTLQAAGAADKPVWYTEIGWPVSHEDGGRYETPENKTFATPLLQAAYTCRLYALALRLNIGRVHNMFVTDTDHFNGGFFLRDGTWRPAAHAVQTMIRMLPNPKLIGSISDGEKGYYAYRFLADGDQNETAENTVTMAWNVAGPRVVEMDSTAETITVTDMLGGKTTKEAVNGKITVEIGPCPVYVSGL